jgi:hypothetical protein
LNISELAKKLKAMADCETGNENERQNAKQKLNELLGKHNLNLDSIIEDDVKERIFVYAVKRKREIFIQVVYKTLNTTNGIKFYSNEGLSTIKNKKDRERLKNVFLLDCTKAQQIEIEFLTDFYYKLYLKEEEFFFSSFIQKHKLFGNNGKSGSISDEDLAKMKSMMEGMCEANPSKLVENKRCIEYLPKL